MARRPRKILSKQFTKASFRLPQTSTQLAQQYNFKPKTWWQRSRFKLLLAGILLVILALIYSPLFRIKNIIISNASSDLAYQQIKQALTDYIHSSKFYVLPQDNLLIFSPAAAKQSLAKSFYLEDITFRRHWPNVLRVILQQDLIAAILKATDQYYTLDKRGVVIAQIKEEELESSLVLIENPDLSAVLPNDQAVDGRLLNFITDLIAEWQANVLPVAIDRILIKNDDLPTLYILTKENWRVLVSTQTTTREQVTNLKTLLVGKIKDDQPKLDYVDVRFGNKLFYKLK